MNLPWRAMADGVLLTLRVTPNAAANRIEGVDIRDDGMAVLRVRVRAVADRGRANAAVIALLADALDAPRSSVTIVSGETARLKTLRVAGDPVRLTARLAAFAPPESG